MSYSGIERRVETNVQLHKAEKAWKPEKVTEADESEETKKKVCYCFSIIVNVVLISLYHHFDHSSCCSFC